jgi:hypothetical protein
LRASANVLIRETFTNAASIQRDWSTAIPEIVGATVSIDDEAVRLNLPSEGEIRLVRRMEMSAVLAKRLRVSARVRTTTPDARARLSITSGQFSLNPTEKIALPAVTRSAWSSVTAVVDIEPSSTAVELAVVLQGKGSAWFDDIAVEVLGTAPMGPSKIELSTQQIENIKALARAIAVIRYRHPSDQVASLDWNVFIPHAVARVMLVKNRRALIEELAALFKSVAPTVVFSESSTYSLREPPTLAGSHLVRWRHFGLGPGSSFASWREGRDPDQATVRVEVLAETPNLSRCKVGQLGARARRLGNDGEVIVYAEISQPGEASRLLEHKLQISESVISVKIDMPSDAYNVRVGIKLTGFVGVELEQLSFTCDDRDRTEIDLEGAEWLHRGTEALFAYEISNCGTKRCVIVRRKPIDTKFVLGRDLVSMEISNHVWVHVPLAVWANGDHTYPRAAEWNSATVFAMNDLPTRLAIIVSAWGTLSQFYPYFDDLKIDWAHELPAALVGMAAADSFQETVWALYHLLAALRDNHGRVYHPDFRMDGLLPVALRRFGDALVVVGAFGDYAKRLPLGTEILEIDNVMAIRAYNKMATQVPSATPGWAAIVIPFWLTLGPAETLSLLKVKTPDGAVNDVVLPHLSRNLYEFLVQESRPRSGSELSPGVFYVNLEGLKSEGWKALLPSLASARTVIMDIRGYPTNAAFSILGHFGDKEIHSPEWQVPIIGSDDYKTSFWTIRPMKPRLNARIICLLDGRAVSAAESVLQILHDNHLATLVGEVSAGTNGNVKVVQLPGGFSMRFTGMRVRLRDGTVLQGKGIVPDHIVHPTLEGVRAGRDEILDEALSLAGQL